MSFYFYNLATWMCLIPYFIPILLIRSEKKINLQYKSQKEKAAAGRSFSHVRQA